MLIGFSGFLQSFFRKEDILIRTGGDEFVVFLKEISREALEKKVSELVKRVGKLTFSKRDFVMSCSVGVCFLQEVWAITVTNSFLNMQILLCTGRRLREETSMQ